MEQFVCNLVFSIGVVIKGVDGAGNFGGGIRIASQHPAVLESLGGCGNDIVFCSGNLVKKNFDPYWVGVNEGSVHSTLHSLWKLVTSVYQHSMILV